MYGKDDACKVSKVSGATLSVGCVFGRRFVSLSQGPICDLTIVFPPNQLSSFPDLCASYKAEHMGFNLDFIFPFPLVDHISQRSGDSVSESCSPN